MKFDALFNQIFIAEADIDVQNKVASPEDVEVEPLPIPEPPEAPVEGEPSENSPSVSGGGTISDYIVKIADFTSVLQDDQGGDCLNQLIKRLDRPATPYEGIDGKIASDLVRVVEGLKGIQTNLLNYKFAAAAGSSNA